MFTQYTLGWPLVLLGSVLLTGSPTSALGFGAFLAVLGTYAFAWEVRQRAIDRRRRPLVMVASPILPIQGGVHLSYLFTLGLGLLFGVGLLSGIRTGRAWRVVGAGVLLGWIFFTRPYDAVLWGRLRHLRRGHPPRPLARAGSPVRSRAASAPCPWWPRPSPTTAT